MDLNELAKVEPNLLREALALAEERERDQRHQRMLENWPKCKCGKRATVAALPEVQYFYYDLHETNYAMEYTLQRGIGSASHSAPSEEADDLDYYVCCDDDKCQSEDWQAIGQHKFHRITR